MIAITDANAPAPKLNEIAGFNNRSFRSKTTTGRRFPIAGTQSAGARPWDEIDQ